MVDSVLAERYGRPVQTTSWALLVGFAISSCHRGENRPTPAAVPTTEGSSVAPGQHPALAGGTNPTVDPAVTGPHVTIQSPGQPPVSVHVEVMRNNDQRERGLMYRRDLDELAGMIFVFPRPEHQVFWMRNTFLPLDMIFITAERRVLGVVRNATPMTDDAREVPGDSMYVLEVRAGFADRHHIADGATVEMTDVPGTLE